MLKPLSALRQRLRLLHLLVHLHQALAVPARALHGRPPRVLVLLQGPSRWQVLESA